MHQDPRPRQLVTRFAPSPTGLLHLGHAYSAWFAWHAARSQGGRFLLRLEDIDSGRCRPEYSAAIRRDLEWLGLDWDGEVRTQSEHFDEYRAVLGRLADQGLIYPCFCTRKDIADQITASGAAPHGPDGPVYPGLCRSVSDGERRKRIAKGQPFALRLDCARAADLAGSLVWDDVSAGPQTAMPEIFGDVVLARKDSPTSYHLAVTWDDALQGVSLVTRGADLFAATHVHRLLQAVLGLPVPRWHHHPLLTDAQGRRFAKRDRSLTLHSLRDAGHTPAEVRALAGITPAGFDGTAR